MAGKRVISAIVGIPVILLVLYFGGVLWWGFFVALAVVAVYEYQRMMEIKQHKPSYIIAYALLAVLITASRYEQVLLPGVFGVFLLAAILQVYKYPSVNVVDIALNLFGAALIGIMIGFAIRIYYLSNSFYLMLLVFLITWATDTGAYFFGMLWGKHKLAPGLSPAKTVEGAVGGLILGVLVTFIYFLFIDLGQISVAYVIILGLCSSISAQVGDLMISSIKRYSGVKDTGSIIPGHGGVLDRFDSFIMVVPLIYYFAVLFL